MEPSTGDADKKSIEMFERNGFPNVDPKKNMWMETSAKAGKNVKELFDKIARALAQDEVSNVDRTANKSKFTNQALLWLCTNNNLLVDVNTPSNQADSQGGCSC